MLIGKSLDGFVSISSFGRGNNILDKSIPLVFIDHKMNFPLPGSRFVREMRGNALHTDV